MTVNQRIAALEAELAEIRKHGGRGSSSEARALRRIAMLTEDQRQPMEPGPRHARFS